MHVVFPRLNFVYQRLMSGYDGSEEAFVGTNVCLVVDIVFFVVCVLVISGVVSCAGITSLEMVGESVERRDDSLHGERHVVPCIAIMQIGGIIMK